MNLLELYNQATIKPEHLPELKKITAKILTNLPTYSYVADTVGLPNFIVGALHCREASFNWKTYLGNGDPLGEKTVHVPFNRGPFMSWSDGAIDALGLQVKLQKIEPNGNWNVVTMLDFCERWNGLGPRKRGFKSGYIWSFTDQYTGGKYVKDGVWDPLAIDKQPGVAAMFKMLGI